MNISDIFEPCDASDWQINPVPIAGRYPKIELLNDDKRYIIKFADYKQNGDEIPYHVSEYIACRLIKSLGYAVQSVAMATYNGNPGCLVEIFEKDLITFDGFGTPTMSNRNLVYDLDVLHELFPENKYNGNFAEYIWDTFLCDSFIHNLDRHPNNWGFYRINDKYEQAPLIDCASSLYSLNAFSLGKMSNIDEYIKKFGNSAIQYKGTRHSFSEILQNETTIQFKISLKKFKQRLSKIKLSCIDDVRLYWEKYSNYTEFVKKFIERQVDMFENRL